MWLLLAALAFADDYLSWARGLAAAPHPEPAYHFAEEAHRAIAPLVEARPGVVRPFEVGRTLDDRVIWGFRVAEPGREVRAKLLVFAQIHALEWVPTEVALRFLADVAAHPPRGVEVTVIPMLNPDGRAKVERDLVEGRNAYRRGNEANVDLNRDFAVNREAKAIWRHVLASRYATSPAALSQPESRALDALAAAEGYDVAISLHAFGGFIYYPWAGLWERPEDWRRLHALGQVMQGGMTRNAYKPRQLSRWGFFFRGHGMEIDHLYGKYGTLAFLVETTRSGLSPFRPRDWGNHFRWYNPADPAPHAAEGAAMLRALAWELGADPDRWAASRR